MKKYIYADNSATTKLKPEVLEKMMPYLTEEYGNPSSVYSMASAPRKAIEEAREKVANAIGALPSEIIFTSGATESDNWAIKGIAHASAPEKKHIISTKIEHHAVLHSLSALEKEGFSVDSEKNYHDISLFSPDNVHLELHFSIKEAQDNIDGLLSKVWDYCVPTENSSYRYKFTSEYFIFHQTAHMSYHFLNGGCGIKPFIDLFLLNKKF